jgi:DNA-binding NarL/FixJ family response regulator
MDATPSAGDAAGARLRRAVLVIEDEPMVLDVLMSALEARGFERVEAGSPPGSVACFRAVGPRGEATEVIVTAVEAASRVGMAPGTRDEHQPARPPRELSPRQAEVLRLVAMGMSNAEIAEMRGTTVSAVAQTVAHALAALGIEARTQYSGHPAPSDVGLTPHQTSGE